MIIADSLAILLLYILHVHFFRLEHPHCTSCYTHNPQKRNFELGRQAANTKLGPKRVHSVRVRGGSLKYRALRLDSGNFAWGSEHVTRKTRIIGVVSICSFYTPKTLQYSQTSPFAHYACNMSLSDDGALQVYNASNNELVRTNTLVKSAIIQIDATPFRQWYEAHVRQIFHYYLVPPF